MKNFDQKGAAHLVVIVVVVLLTAVTGVSLRVYQANKEKAARESASQQEAANKAAQEALKDQSKQEAEQVIENTEAPAAPASTSTAKPKAAAPKAVTPSPAPATPTVENKPDSSNCNMNSLYYSNASGFTATKDAATGSPAIFTVPGYTLVTASECTYNGSWRKVVYNGQTGYTHKDNVQISQ